MDRIQPALAGLAFRTAAARDGIPCVEVEVKDVRETCRRLRDACGFEQSTFVTAVDLFPAEPRFEVLWQLLSFAHGDRVRVRTRVPSRDPRVPTVADLWPGAAFGERECYDMFGVVFTGHPGLSRLMMPEEYGHFPLRKDFPHLGIEPDRLYREWDRRRHARAPEEAAP